MQLGANPACHVVHLLAMEVLVLQIFWVFCHVVTLTMWNVAFPEQGVPCLLNMACHPY